MARAIAVEKRENRVGGRPRPPAWRPSAARGSARRAGASAESRVTPTPTSAAMSIVRGCERDARRRDVGAHGLEQQVDGLGDAEAGDDADGRGEHAQRERLGDHGAEHLAAAGAEGAQHRELAAPLCHGDAEGVEDDERADEDGDAGERQKHRRQEAVDGGGRLAGRVRGRLLAGLDVTVAGNAAFTRGQLLGRDARVGGDRDAAQLAGLAAQRCTSCRRPAMTMVPPMRAGVAPLEHAGDL